MAKEPKTNAMRRLDSAKIPYETRSYAYNEEDLSGVHAAEELGADPGQVFKTLVTRGDKGAVQVFCIPVAEELDLKKCAALCGEKRLEMAAVKDLLSLTGYIRGGCSPIGMKKQYPTHLDRRALEHSDGIYISAGQRGRQIFLRPADLSALLGAPFADLIKEK